MINRGIPLASFQIFISSTEIIFELFIFMYVCEYTYGLFVCLF